MPAPYRLIVLAAEANDRRSQTVRANTYDVEVGASSYDIATRFVGALVVEQQARTHAIFVDAIAYPDEGDRRTLARTSASVGHHSGTFGMVEAAVTAAISLAEEGLAPRAEAANRFDL